jgi:transcriptional regulatory protein LevR
MNAYEVLYQKELKLQIQRKKMRCHYYKQYCFTVTKCVLNNGTSQEFAKLNRLAQKVLSVCDKIVTMCKITSTHLCKQLTKLENKLEVLEEGYIDFLGSLKLKYDH